MYKWLLPTGMIALFLSALTLSAQVRQELPQPAPKQTSTVTQPKTTSPDRGAIDTGKAPSKDAKSTKQARRRRHSRVYLGVCTVPVEDMTSRMRRKLKIKEDDGVVVVEVMPDSPAEEAGLKHGDVITHVNGKLVEDEEELCDDLNRFGTDKPVKLDICREGKKQQITANLEEGSIDELIPAHFTPGGNEGVRGREHELLDRIDHLERRIYHLENRLQDMERGRSVRGQ